MGDSAEQQTLGLDLRTTTHTSRILSPESAPGPRKEGLVGGPERAEKGSSIVEPRAVGHSGQENSGA